MKKTVLLLIPCLLLTSCNIFDFLDSLLSQIESNSTSTSSIITSATSLSTSSSTSTKPTQYSSSSTPSNTVSSYTPQPSSIDIPSNSDSPWDVHWGSSNAQVWHDADFSNHNYVENWLYLYRTEGKTLRESQYYGNAGHNGVKLDNKNTGLQTPWLKNTLLKLEFVVNYKLHGNSKDYAKKGNIFEVYAFNALGNKLWTGTTPYNYSFAKPDNDGSIKYTIPNNDDIAYIQFWMLDFPSNPSSSKGANVEIFKISLKGIPYSAN